THAAQSPCPSCRPFAQARPLSAARRRPPPPRRRSPAGAPVACAAAACHQYRTRTASAPFSALSVCLMTPPTPPVPSPRTSLSSVSLPPPPLLPCWPSFPHRLPLAVCMGTAARVSYDPGNASDTIRHPIWPVAEQRGET